MNIERRHRVAIAAGILLTLCGAALGLAFALDWFEEPGGEDVVVILKTTGPHMEFWQIVRAGIRAAAVELDVEPRIVGPRWERDVDHQIAIFESVIDEEPDAVLLAASDFTRLVPLAEEAARRGITVVTLDSALDSDVPVSFVATDNVAAGEAAGREIDRLVDGNKRIAIISHIRGTATAIDREAGTLNALIQRDPALIVGPFYAQNDPDLAYQIVERVVEDYPDLGGIVALNENSTVGAGRAVRDLAVSDTIALVGFDNSKEEIEFLEDGIVKALVVQRPFNMGYLGISTVVEALRGQAVDAVIATGAVLVRKEDMFTEENQKLLFPLVETN
jgi:ribose transport system substrate-binding protein